MTNEKEEFFPEINADVEDSVTVIESLCLRCHEQGVTRLMLTKIPYFREVIVSSFECKSCNYHDSSIQSGGSLQEKGVLYSLKVATTKDLDRQIIKSEHSIVKIPELDFEQPPSGKGTITTVEGLLDSVIDGINYLQDERKKADEELASKLDAFVLKLQEFKKVYQPFTVILDDPSGNSFIENPNYPTSDPLLQKKSYNRTKEQAIAMGYEHEWKEKEEITNPAEEEGTADWNFKSEVMTFQTACPSCRAPCHTNMKMIDIPHFKQVVVMATVCEACGHRDNEVKAGVGVEEEGMLLSLTITNQLDLNRDVLKSETAGIKIPELDFEMVGGSLGGKFTTVEGLLTQVKDQLSGDNPFIQGDTSHNETKKKVEKFCEKLDEIITGKMRFVHIELDDPAGNSYIQSLTAPQPDPHLAIVHYKRSKDQDEELGISHMKTEDY